MSKNYQIEKEVLQRQYQQSAERLYQKPLAKLNPDELNAVIAEVIKMEILPKQFQYGMHAFSEKRIAIYFSIEFLIGRIVLDMLANVGIKKATEEIFEEEGIDIHVLEDVEDTALGNGGLGRLAACFIESAATQGYAVYGVGLYYKYGLFNQTFFENNQVEKPDDWTSKGEPWFERIEQDAVIVKFADTQVKAVPYVLPIVGYNANQAEFQSFAFPLTLWKAEALEGLTNENAAQISDYLYPKDSTEEGKKLRIRQEYFFVSATLQRLFQIHLSKHETLDQLEKYYAFQMNDTHPVMGCLEYIRLLKENGYSFDQAFKKAAKCFNYTNHTIMAEALEKWPRSMLAELLPDIYKIIEEINQRLIDELQKKDEFNILERDGHPCRDTNWAKVHEYEMFDMYQVYMGRIACYVSHKINGVAAVHSEIIKKETLHKWYVLYPEKFENVTNGVTPRRWLKLSNEPLAAFLDKYVGTQWTTNLELLEGLEKYKNDATVLREYAGIKRIAKRALAKYILKKEGIFIDVNSIFDCQVKRIHEYKRQLMNALRIIYIYDQIKKGNLKDFYKTTFIIGGKAASEYHMAKQIISMIKDLQDLVNNDPEVKDKMQVVFLTNFNVSYGEKVYAGADFSEQISTAGTEASGTSNMKFMMNGAPTIGTLDGANIEIFEEGGSKNNYIFGSTIEEMKRIQPMYNQRIFLDANKDLENLLDYFKDESCLRRTYWDFVNALTYHDKYFVMYDLRSYIHTFLRANMDYAMEQKTGDLEYYTRKCFKNTAHSGKFSSDRTISEYAKKIWNLEPWEK